MKKRFYLQLFFSTVLLSIIPVLILTFFNSRYYSRVLENEINGNNEVLLNSLIDKVDKEIYSLKNDFISFVIENQNLNYFVSQKRKNELYRTADLVADINKFVSKYEYVRDVVVYMNNQPYLLTSDGSFRYDYYFDQYQSEELELLQDEASFFSSSFIADFRQANDNYYKVILLNVTLPFKTEDYTVFCSIVIDQEMIFGNISNLELTKEGSIIVVNEKDQVIYSGSSEIATDSLFSSLPESGNEFNFNGNDFFATSIDSEQTQWEYICLIPFDEISSKIDKSQYISYFLCLLSVSLGLGAAILLTKKLYRPVTGLTDIFFGRGKEPKNRDEFAFIKENIDDIIDSNNKLKEKILEYLPGIQNNFLKDLVHGNVSDETLKSDLVRYHIKFPLKHVAVMLCELKKSDGTSDNIENVEAVLRKYYSNYYLLKENHWAVILNFNDDNIGDIVAEAEEYCKVICQGNVFSDIHRISDSYNQAKYCMEYVIPGMESQYIPYGELCITNVSNYLHPEEFENLYKNYIDSGKYNEALVYITKEIRTYINRGIPMHFVQRNMDNLLYYLIKQCRDMNYNLSDIFGVNYNYYDCKSKLGSIGEWQAYMINLYTRFIDYVSEKRLNSGKVNFSKIEQFVKDNLHNDISLEMVSERFCISYFYLSKLFKDCTGYGYTEYITHLRIAAAKEILRNSNRKIKEISGLVGYNSSVTFIRNFKKYEGISPGEYRGKEM